jgi:hypothetical protein
MTRREAAMRLHNVTTRPAFMEPIVTCRETAGNRRDLTARDVMAPRIRGALRATDCLLSNGFKDTI